MNSFLTHPCKRLSSIKRIYSLSFHQIQKRSIINNVKYQKSFTKNPSSHLRHNELYEAKINELFGSKYRVYAIQIDAVYNEETLNKALKYITKRHPKALSSIKDYRYEHKSYDKIPLTVIDKKGEEFDEILKSEINKNLLGPCVHFTVLKGTDNFDLIISFNSISSDSLSNLSFIKQFLDYYTNTPNDVDTNDNYVTSYFDALPIRFRSILGFFNSLSPYKEVAKEFSLYPPISYLYGLNHRDNIIRRTSVNYQINLNKSDKIIKEAESKKLRLSAVIGSSILYLMAISEPKPIISGHLGLELVHDLRKFSNPSIPSDELTNFTSTTFHSIQVQTEQENLNIWDIAYDIHRRYDEADILDIPLHLSPPLKKIIDQKLKGRINTSLSLFDHGTIDFGDVLNNAKVKNLIMAETNKFTTLSVDLMVIDNKIVISMNYSPEIYTDSYIKLLAKNISPLILNELGPMDILNLKKEFENMNIVKAIQKFREMESAEPSSNEENK